MKENIASAEVDRVVDVEVGPVKRFFIDILTRDIEIPAAVLDLVDNSVDSANAMFPEGDLSTLRIDVEADAEHFAISDNCAGITLHAAETYVFKMGRPENIGSSPSSIGQFGVGMKRALFKMGDEFIVDSSTGTSHFSVELVVSVWEKMEEWTIPLRVHKSGTSGYPNSGTTIIISNLTEDVRGHFADPVRQNQLRDELRSKHRMAIERGLKIYFNGQLLPKTPTVLATSESNEAPEIFPLIERFSLENEDGKTVRVEIYAGIHNSAATEEDAEPEDVTVGSAEAGWYVFGNDRLLLAADKTWLTGWGGTGNLPLYHNQYARFRGFVYMWAEDSIALPWNTTKTGVESSDPVWTRVRGEMITAGKQVITLLNLLKIERRALNTIDTGTSPELYVPITQALGRSKLKSTAALREYSPRALFYVTPNNELGRLMDGKRISYSVTLRDFKSASELLGSTKAAEIGRRTFEYFLDCESEG